MTQHSLLNTSLLGICTPGPRELAQTICNPIPLFHIMGLSTGVLFPLQEEFTKVFPFYFPETLSTIKAIEAYKCDSLRGTPTQFFDILNREERKKHDLSSLMNRFVGGSTVPADLLEKLKKELNIQNFVIGYGNKN